MKKWLGIQHPNKTINFFTSRGYLRQAHKANIDLGRVQQGNLGSIDQHPTRFSKFSSYQQELRIFMRRQHFSHNYLLTQCIVSLTFGIDIYYFFIKVC